jgi:hypothetical protein
MEDIYAADFRNTGTAGYNFLKIPSTARHVAIGESAGAIVANAGILPLFLNPAVLGFQDRSVIGVSYSPWIADIDHYVAGVTLSLGSVGRVGLGIINLDYGSMSRTEQTSTVGEYEVLGVYKAQSLALGLTYSRKLTDKFAYGLRTNLVRETIYNYSSTNILLDMGIIYFTGFNSLRIGGFVNNFGLNARFIGDTFKMPTELHLSMAYDILDKPMHLITLSGELTHPSDNIERIHFGVEYQYNNTCFVRAGYKPGYDEDTFAFGGGIIWKKLFIDVAATPFGRFPSVYRLTLQKEL